MTEAEFLALLGRNDAGPDGDTGPTIILPPGTISFTDTVTISDRGNLILEGQGDLSTRLQYNGATSKDFFVLDHCNGVQFRNIWFDGNDKADDVLVIKTNATPPAWPNSGNNYFVRCSFTKGVVHGVSIDNTANDAVTNNGNVFERVAVNNCDNGAGYHMKGENVSDTKFLYCTSTNNRYGVYAEDGCDFTWTSGQCTQSDIDFFIGTNGRKLVIYDHRTEGSKQFLVSGANQVLMDVLMQVVTLDMKNGHPDTAAKAYGAYTIDLQTGGSIKMSQFAIQETTTSNNLPSLFKFVSTDGGRVSIQGVNLTQNNYPNSDIRQQPFFIDSNFTIEDRLLFIRDIGIPVARYRIELDPTDDVTDGRQDVTLTTTSYAEGDYTTPTWTGTAGTNDEFGLGNSDGTKQRSFSVLIRYNFSSLATTPGDIELAYICGLTFYLAKDNGTYTFTVGNSDISVSGLSPATATNYDLVVSYNRDRDGELFVKFGSLVSTQTGSADSVLSDSDTINIGTIDASPTAGAGEMIGTAGATCKSWDRALTSAEVGSA